MFDADVEVSFLNVRNRIDGYEIIAILILQYGPEYQAAKHISKGAYD